MEQRKESTALAAQAGFERTLVPIVRIAAWLAVGTLFLATITLIVTRGSGPAGGIARTLFGFGLLPLGSLVGLAGMLVLPVKEKAGLFAGLLLVAWLTA